MTKIVVYEPVTFLTDVMISFLCFYFVRRIGGSSSPALKNWRYFFLFTAFSTFVGGCVHGFFPLHDTLTGKLVWGLAHLLSSVALFYAQSATINYLALTDKMKRILFRCILLQLVLTFIAIVGVHNFTVMIVSLAIGYIPIVVFFFRRAGNGNQDGLFIATGFSLCLSTGFIFMAKFSFSDWFNFNDISHVVLMIGFSLVFSGLQNEMAKKELLLFGK